MSTTNNGVNLRPRGDLATSLQEFDVQTNMAGMIGLEIAPVYEVDETKGDYQVLPIGSMLQDIDDRRAPDGSYNRVDGFFEEGDYKTQEHGVEERVDHRKRAEYASIVRSDSLAALRTRHIVALRHEKRVIEKALANTNTKAVSSSWHDTVNSDPVKDITEQVIKAWETFGVVLNRLVLPYSLFKRLGNHEKLIERFGKATSEAGQTRLRGMLAEIFDVERVIVAKAQTNAANSAKAPAILQSLWPADRAMLYAAGDSDDLTMPQLMRTFHWSEDGSVIGGVFEEYELPSIRSSVIRHRMDTDEKVVYPGAGVVFTGLTVPA